MEISDKALTPYLTSDGHHSDPDIIADFRQFSAAYETENDVTLEPQSPTLGEVVKSFFAARPSIPKYDKSKPKPIAAFKSAIRSYQHGVDDKALIQQVKRNAAAADTAATTSTIPSMPNLRTLSRDERASAMKDFKRQVKRDQYHAG
jgi:hypothetical protein